MKRKTKIIGLLIFIVGIMICNPVIGARHFSAQSYIKVFYPLYWDTNTVYTKEYIGLKRWGDTNSLLENMMKYPKSKDFIPTLSDSVKINYVKVGKDPKLLNVDFSSDLIGTMTMGTAMETEVLKSIVNTLGEFYNVDYVYITVDGNIYESGHYRTPEKGFKVKLEDIEEL